ncbi:MAG: phosphoesterase [Gemmatimonadetes bacterium]|nr:phosphoesterase [Gemmatimonadota bacterium]
MLNLVFAALFQAQQPAPHRNVPDPGVIATGQRVSPAGVQSSFDGRVSGVRFGKSSDEVWVAAPNVTYRLDWRGNRAIARATVVGTPGVYGIAIDPVTRRALVSSVGRIPASSVTPGTTPTRAPAVTHLSALDGEAAGDSVAPLWRSAALGDYMAGGPAIASKAGADGKRIAVVPLPANDALAVLDAESGALIRTIPLGVEPIAAAISADGSVAYVTILGGPKPTTGQRQARQCCDPRAEAVRVDARGIAEAGTVSRVDVVKGVVERDIVAGRHPTSIVWDQRGNRLFVAEGNSDSVTVIDTKTNAATRMGITPFRERKIGLAPTALALTPDGHTLFVALGGANAVAMYDVSTPRARLLGLIPTAWYPNSLDVSADGSLLAVGALLGVGSGEGTTSGKRGRYVHANRGSVNVLPIPTASELVALTTAVAANNRLHLASAGAPAAMARSNIPRAVPLQPGDPSLIEHVVFIVRENRTYDQVLGDLGRGAGDSSLTTYGRDVTPNAHALSEQFVTLDHFFASGGNSADGHNWLTQANETEYPMWPLYFGRSYPSEGVDAMAYSSGGFLWESAQAKGKTVTIFGEYAPSQRDPKASERATMLDQYMQHPNDFALHKEMLAKRYNTRSEIPSLDKTLIREYPGWTQESPDVVKAGDILWHLGNWEKAGTMPNLILVILPSDHTEGTSADWCAPRACVADNDLALGKIVDGLSHSQFWKDMAILVVEDDAQNGVDHIDGHRTVALAISPYAKRGIVDSTFYAQPSMVKTIELMLGLPALSIFDLVATDMRASFIDHSVKPDLRPYTALTPKQSLLDKNKRVGAITGPDAAERKKAALASARMNLAEPDAAPSEALNRILWHDAKGFKTPYPTVKRSLFFPMSVDIADEDREEREEKPVKGAKPR